VHASIRIGDEGRATAGLDTPRAPACFWRAGIRPVDNTCVTLTGTIPAPAVAAPPHESNLRRNLAALAARGIHLEPPSPGAIEAATAAPLRTSHAWDTALAAGDAMKPLIIEGIAPLESVLALWRNAPPQPDGFSRRFILVQADEREFVEALCAADASAMLSEPRVECFVGTDAADRLGAWLLTDDRQGTALPAQVVRSPVLRRTLAPNVESIIKRAADAQTGLHESIRTRVLAAFAGRGRDHWAARFAPGERLRVLLPISRYSTFVRHSAQDLAAALRRAGHEAFVLSEPDPHSRLTSPAYLRTFDTVRPDLVVLINYTRRHMAQAVPGGVPVVCWVQDRMAHLFDPAAGAAQSELDFLLGHLHPDLFSHFNYPRNNRAFAFVPACAERFTPAPPSNTPRPAHAPKSIDIGYVSHQSETPERFHLRIKPMFAGSAPVLASLDPLYAAAARWMDNADADPVAPRPDRKSMVTAALDCAGLKSPDERLVFTVFGNYLVPLMERMVRHRTLAWAARVGQRRGWRLRLFGRGWDSHPTLAPFAVGEVEHDDASLPEVYRSCTAHLHASINTNSHQRVYECALSAGLMLRRGPSPDGELAKVAMLRLAASKPPVDQTPEGVPVYQADEHDGVGPSRFFAAFGRKPPFDENARPVYRKPLTPEHTRTLLNDWPEFPIHSMPDFGFPDARETMFASESELESILTRAATDPAWRERTIAAHRACVLEHATYDTLAASMLRTVRDGLRPAQATR